MEKLGENTEEGTSDGVEKTGELGLVIGVPGSAGGKIGSAGGVTGSVGGLLLTYSSYTA